MTSRIRDARDFQAVFDVSRETLDQLVCYHALLTKWSPRINLVSASSLDDAWRRHFADSAQLWTMRPAKARHWADLGSGAGFPGMVIAILAAACAPDLRVTLLESDQRKAVFLGEVARACGISVTVFAERLESQAPLQADVLSARALAPLRTLLGAAEKHRCQDGICLFHKGETVHKELAGARAAWQFDHRIHPSLTHPGAGIVEIGAIARV